MATAASIAEILESLVALLATGNGSAWTPALASLRDDLQAAQDDEPQYQCVVRRILRLSSQGMGGFNDLVLQVDGQVLPQQAELEVLRRRLFEAAHDQLM